MKITVNGNIKEVYEGINVEELIASSFEKNKGIIVELNEKIVHRNHWSEQLLQEGDVLQLIQFIGGG
jgi:sulfur carrier protein